MFLENGLGHLVPFQHPDMDKWRDSLRHGLMSRVEDTNIILTGGVDNIWKNTENEKLVVADYKSQANNKELEPESYLSDVYKEGYKVQMDFYAFLLHQMEFEVEDTAYFLVCNVDRQAGGFHGKMKFKEVLIPYKWNSDWISDKVADMIDLLNNQNAPHNRLKRALHLTSYFEKVKLSSWLMC